VKLCNSFGLKLNESFLFQPIYKVVFDKTEAKLSLVRLLGTGHWAAPNRRITAGTTQVTRRLRRATGPAEQWE